MRLNLNEAELAQFNLAIKDGTAIPDAVFTRLESEWIFDKSLAKIDSDGAFVVLSKVSDLKKYKKRTYQIKNGHKVEVV